VPYTISHVAAVIPAYRPLSRAQVFSAAVVGSIVPDFDLLFPHYLSRVETHSFQALFTYCLPVGLLTYLFTRVLIKPALIECLPNGAYARLQASKPAISLRAAKNWLMVAAAILFGAATHIIWDAFTHEKSLGVRTFPFLKGFGPGLEGHPMQLFRWLQFGSSAIGLAILAIALIVWLRHAPAPSSPSPRRLGPVERTIWLVMYLAPPVADAGWLLLRVLASGTLQVSAGYGIVAIAVASIRGAVISLIGVSILIRIRLASI